MDRSELGQKIQKMMVTQHWLPAWQYVPAGHAAPFTQLGTPDGHDAAAPHDGGRSLGS